MRVLGSFCSSGGDLGHCAVAVLVAVAVEVFMIVLIFLLGSS